MEYNLGEHGEAYWKHKILEIIDCINLISTIAEQIDKEEVEIALTTRNIDYHVSLYYLYVKKHRDKMNEFTMELER